MAVSVPTVPPLSMIAIGASTGGTEAISTLMAGLRPPLPGIVIVQHIPAMFSRLFAERLDSECFLHVKEAEEGETILPNTVYIAPGGKHMRVGRMGQRYWLSCRPGPPVHSVCPSVDVLFDSVAECVGRHALGVILTGMGKDGAEGLLAMRKAGAHTIGQDPRSCVVYGMPHAAMAAGAVEWQLPLSEIAPEILRLVRLSRK